MVPFVSPLTTARASPVEVVRAAVVPAWLRCHEKYGTSSECRIYPTVSWMTRLSENALWPHSCAVAQQPGGVPARRRTPATRARRGYMGMYRYASTPHPTVIAVEMAAYIRDLAVSLTKHSGMEPSTSARRGTPPWEKLHRLAVQAGGGRIVVRHRGGAGRHHAPRERGRTARGPRTRRRRLRIDHGEEAAVSGAVADAIDPDGPKARRDVTATSTLRQSREGRTRTHRQSARDGGLGGRLDGAHAEEGTPTEAIAAIAGETGDCTCACSGARRRFEDACVPHTRGCFGFR